MSLHGTLIRFFSDMPFDVILPIFLASRMSGFMAHWCETMSRSALVRTSSIGAFRLTQQYRAALPIILWRPNQVYTGHRAGQQTGTTVKSQNII